MNLFNLQQKKASEFEWWDDEEYCPSIPVLPVGHSLMRKVSKNRHCMVIQNAKMENAGIDNCG